MRIVEKSPFFTLSNAISKKKLRWRPVFPQQKSGKTGKKDKKYPENQGIFKEIQEIFLSLAIFFELKGPQT